MAFTLLSSNLLLFLSLSFIPLTLTLHSATDVTTWVPTSTLNCWGTSTMAECLATEGAEGGVDEEFMMDSEINRRILAIKRYISYGALRRNNVPCSRRGASYYNCRPGGPVNPYRRGCSRITRCRRS